MTECEQIESGAIPFAELLRIMHPLRSGKCPIAMLRAYFDESEDPAGITFVVGGWIGNSDEWDGVQSKWLATLPSSIEYFHAHECVMGTEQFEGWEISERHDLLESLCDVLIEHKVYLLASGIHQPTYKRFAAKA